MPTHYQIILCTCPDKDTAEKLARLLVTGKLAACVNILAGYYLYLPLARTTGIGPGTFIVIKANKTVYQAIETTIKEHHPYELPEIIAVAIESGLPEYLHWIDSCHSSK